MEDVHLEEQMIVHRNERADILSNGGRARLRPLTRLGWSWRIVVNDEMLADNALEGCRVSSEITPVATPHALRSAHH